MEAPQAGTFHHCVPAPRHLHGVTAEVTAPSPTGKLCACALGASLRPFIQLCRAVAKPTPPPPVQSCKRAGTPRERGTHQRKSRKVPWDSTGLQDAVWRLEERRGAEHEVLCLRFFSLLCLSPASNPHLYSELVPEGTFQKQQAAPPKQLRDTPSMQFHLLPWPFFPRDPTAQWGHQGGPAWQVRAAGQGAASSMGPLSQGPGRTRAFRDQREVGPRGP